MKAMCSDRRSSLARSAIVTSMAVVAGLVLPVRAAEIDWAKKRKALGRQDKLRVLVDKVLSASNKWVMTEKFMDEIRDAGFNVIVPRVGGGDMKRVERVARMAQDRGMFYMAWMRGTRGTKTGPKLVWAKGAEQDLYSPNADELWDWMTRLILGHARLSAANPAIVGSFLDFENYAKGKQGNCYALSYDAKILAEFAKDKGLNLPKLEPKERCPWLKTNGHTAAFRDYQIQSWRRRCRKLRQQIDAINPRFQLIVYPRPTLFLNEAIYPEWSTTQAPMILADHFTYHRPGRLPHDRALKANKRSLESGVRFGRSKNVPLLYMGGIDPIYEDADPEFCGRNAVMICEASDGYWIFYEGPSYHKPDHAAYFKWFSRANRAIVAGEFDFWKAPRETPDPMVAARERLLKKYCGADVKPYATDPMPQGTEKAVYTVRTHNTDEAVFGVLLRVGEALRGRLQVRRLGTYTGGSEYVLFGPSRRKVAEGQAELGKPAELKCVAKQAGLHVIIVNSSPNAAQLHVKNQQFCLIGTKRTGFIGAQPLTYFLPAPNAREITLTLRSPSPAETVAMTVLDPAGQQVAKVDTVASKERKVKLTVPSGTAGKPWSLRLDRAPKGALEDVSLSLDAGCSDFLATHPSRLLVWSK